VKDPNALLDLMSHHKGKYSDKWNSYIDFYCNLFSPIRNQETDILEIGVENGGSLEIWAKFFPSAQKILGYDIDPKCGALAFDDSRIQVLVGDSSHIEAGQKIKNLTSNLGIVIDDGSHKSSDIIRSFLMFFPQLKHGGVYVIEDLCTSYWTDHELHFVNGKRTTEYLLDLIMESGRDPHHKDFLTDILSVKFYRSIAFITKR
jgi:cephalosporin hydroxylase